MTFPYSYTRKSYPSGALASLSAKGSSGKSLPKEVEEQFPGKSFHVKTDPTGVNVVFHFDEGLTGAEETTLTNTINNFSITENPLKLVPNIDRTHRYEEMEYSGNNLVRKTYYLKKDGNGDFIDKTKEWTYQYQGNNLVSSIMTEYTKDGLVHKTETYNYSTETTGNTRIVRKELQ